MKIYNEKINNAVKQIIDFLESAKLGKAEQKEILQRAFKISQYKGKKWV